MGDYYKKTRWEGESFAYKLKFAYAKYPFFVFSCVASVIIISAATAIRISTYKGSRYEALQKYKSAYMVVRDDDPKLDYIIEQKERGRHFFPKY